MPVHLASDRLIKKRNRICQSHIGAAWRWAGRWAAVAVTGGRPDNRITAVAERIKGEEAIVTQSPLKHGRHPRALGSATEACDCWVSSGGGTLLPLGSCAFRMWQLHRRMAPVRASEGQQTCADVGRSPLWCCTFVSWLMESQPALY